MIKVDFVLKNNFYTELTIKGHANYAEEGSDIVCSAVSAIGVGCLNAIEKIKGEEPKYKIDDGYINVLFDNDETSQIIAKTVHVQLMGIEESYSKYLKIKITTM